MTTVIYTNGWISIDGEQTGLGVCQRKKGTIVYWREVLNLRNYEQIEMPKKRYSLAHNNPESGVAGREEFEIDVRAYLDSQQ